MLQQFVHSSYSARRAGAVVDRQRRARRVQGHRRASGASRCSSCPGARDQAELVADVADGVLVQSVQRHPLRRQPDQRRLLHRRRRPADRQRRARRAGPRVHDRIDAAADAARHRRGRFRRRLAADARRRRQPRHPRRHDERRRDRRRALAARVDDAFEHGSTADSSSDAAAPARVEHHVSGADEAGLRQRRRADQRRVEAEHACGAHRELGPAERIGSGDVQRTGDVAHRRELRRPPRRRRRRVPGSAPRR